MGRGKTMDEFAAEHGPRWFYYGGLPGDPGIVTDAARHYGDLYDLDAEELDNRASEYGWEHHNQGYDDKIRKLALVMRAAKRNKDALRRLGQE